MLALKNKPLIQRADKLLGPAKILVVTLVFVSQKDVERMMKVVAPDGIEAVAVLSLAGIASVILVGLGNHAHRAAKLARKLINVLLDVRNDVQRRIVLDGLYGIEPQTVEVIFANPAERVLDDEAANVLAARLIVVDGITPWRAVLAGEIGPKLPQITALVAEVVVNHVEHDGQAALVGDIHQSLQACRAAVARLDCVQTNTVVAPIARSRKCRNRHELDDGDAQAAQVIEFFDNPFKRAGRSEGAGMQLVNDVLLKSKPTPVAVAPFVSLGIDDLGWPVHSLRQVA